MKKTPNVKALKLMVGDHVKVGGSTFRIAILNYRFGSSYKMVNIALNPINDDGHRMWLKACPKQRFTVYRKTK